jgi:uncharacterized protein
MQLAVPRYTQRTFPRYRYIPTQSPHPVIDPNGHSYKKVEEKVSFSPPEKWKQNDLYLYGVDLFNHGYWWEAHEAWETVWMTTPKTDVHGQFLQGLIQFSAAVLKLYSGSKNGFENLLKESQKKLQVVCRDLAEHNRHYYMGLNLEKWMGRINTFYSSLEEVEGQPTDPLNFASFPAIILES